jgi:hypothetical protein
MYIVTSLVKFLKTFCRISVPYPFQWGPPTFDAGEAFAMMMTSFIALVEVCWNTLPKLAYFVFYPFKSGHYPFSSSLMNGSALAVFSIII